MQATREAGPLLQAAASPELRSAVRSAPREHTGGLTRCDSHAGARRRLFASGYAAPPTRSYETEGGRYRLRQLVTKQLRTIKRPHSNESNVNERRRHGSRISNDIPGSVLYGTAILYLIRRVCTFSARCVTILALIFKQTLTT